uniref:Ankycorbin-like n=2 Tax=Seriola lalandi dorsalis TaxID=1841481 RepID=A0A3B4WLH5_SERLL
MGLFCPHSLSGEVSKPAPNKFLNHLRIMLKASGKSDEQTGTKILLEAMSKDKVHLARFVLDALDGEIVDSITEGAQTPLISSVLLPDGQTRCKFVELLLQRGASVNCQDGNGRTAISYACEKGYLDAVKILVRSNADPEIVDCWGNTALMYAAVAGHSPVVEFLVRAFKRLGLQIDRQNKVGNSAVGVAKFLGHTECIFALTNSSKKGRESEGGAQGNTQPRLSLRCGEVNDKFERKVGHLVNKLGVLQTCNRADCLLVQNCTWQPRPPIRQSKLPSMDSIEEFERENDSSSSPPQELNFSGVLTHKTHSDHSPNCKHRKTGERPTAIRDHLPPLIQICEPQKSIFFSPRPSRNTPKPSATSTLGILLTPILANKSESELGTEKSKMLDFGVRRFHDSYYQKRCSLPTSILSPTPPERTLVPLLKSRTVRRREASPCKAEPQQFTAPAASASTTTFSVFSNKLLRRFTSPEFKKDVKDLDPVLTSGRIPRSETFPQSIKHPQVGSKPSIDSISSVKCEFDFHFRVPNS